MRLAGRTYQANANIYQQYCYTVAYNRSLKTIIQYIIPLQCGHTAMSSWFSQQLQMQQPSKVCTRGAPTCKKCRPWASLIDIIRALNLPYDRNKLHMSGLKASGNISASFNREYDSGWREHVKTSFWTTAYWSVSCTPLNKRDHLSHTPPPKQKKLIFIASSKSLIIRRALPANRVVCCFIKHLNFLVRLIRSVSTSLQIHQ
jgi:hypothetical protein